MRKDIRNQAKADTTHQGKPGRGFTATSGDTFANASVQPSSNLSIICHGCGGLGHIRRNCPEANKQSQGKGNRPGKGNYKGKNFNPNFVHPAQKSSSGSTSGSKRSIEHEDTYCYHCGDDDHVSTNCPIKRRAIERAKRAADAPTNQLAIRGIAGGASRDEAPGY